jgi:serine/threonine protein kinase
MPMTIKEKAQRVWDKADETLKYVDNAYIFSVAKETCRDFPTFDAKEITSGSLLGRGGFSNVFEVISITLLSKDEEKMKQTPEQSSDNHNHQNPQTLACQTTTDTTTTTTTTTTNNTNNNQDTTRQRMDDTNEEDHYHVDTARDLMANRCMRYGSARYAMKRLRPDLNQLDYARAALDLAIEIKYMSVLMHPNIVKMRAYSNTPRLSVDTFIIMGK